MLGQKIEITAMHRDEHEFPVELSISPAARSKTTALFVGFARDLSTVHRRKQMAEAQAACPGGTIGMPWRHRKLPPPG